MPKDSDRYKELREYLVGLKDGSEAKEKAPYDQALEHLDAADNLAEYQGPCMCRVRVKLGRRGILLRSRSAMLYLSQSEKVRTTLLLPGRSYRGECRGSGVRSRLLLPHL